MEPRYRIKSLVARSGEHVDLPTSGVTCIVGRNNVGKTLTLNDILAIATNRADSSVPLILSGLHVDKNALTYDDVETWLTGNFPRLGDRDRRTVARYQSVGGNAVTADQFLDFWNAEGDAYVGPAASYVMLHCAAGSLVHRAVSQQYISGSEMANSPLMRVHLDSRLEEKLSELAFRAFGKRLTLDRVSLQGSVFRVGEVGVPRPPFNDSSLAYYEALIALPRLEQEGEGVKSFMGLALEVLAGQYQVLVVDEPEAFLHPGQARALGRWLGQVAAETDKQVILATHDRDVVVGLLDSGPDAKVAVVRIDRTDDIVRLHHLGHSAVMELWSDPVNRYSNVLQGLFHANVVICEGDADCRFYGAVLDHLAAERGFRAVYDDTLFVPSGGKGREYKVAQSLTRLKVHTSAIVDFDAIFDKKMLRNLLIALGGSWSASIQDDHQAFLNHYNSLDQGQRETLKNQGLHGLKGAVHVSCKKLIESLAQQRLLVAGYGEMEDFDKSITAGKGAPWVSEMLEKMNHETNAGARQMLTRLSFVPESSK